MGSFRRFRSTLLVAILAGTLIAPALHLAQAFTLIQLPSELFTLNYAAAESSPQNGVFPDSGRSGTTFTFVATYFDRVGSVANGFSPTTAELHLDLNGDGVVGATVVPHGATPLPPELLVGLAMLLLTAILLRILARRWRRLSLPYVTVLTVILMLGCGGGSGGGLLGGSDAFAALQLATCTGPASETVLLPSPGGDFTLGQDFTTNVTLNCSPGIVLFRYKFIITNPADGAQFTVISGTAVNYNFVTITP